MSVINIIQAINKISHGHTITSCTGSKYTYDMLQPKWFGGHYASFQTSGMMEVEKKGEWVSE